jgi:sec-independent protein translocase protein TatA
MDHGAAVGHTETIMPFGIHPAFLVILLVIVLIIFGPGKLPSLGGAIGRSIREFKKTTNEDDEPEPATEPGTTTTKATTTTTTTTDDAAPK